METVVFSTLYENVYFILVKVGMGVRRDGQRVGFGMLETNI